MKKTIFAASLAVATLMSGAVSAAQIDCTTGVSGPDLTSFFKIDDATSGVCLDGSQDFAADVNGLGASGAFGFSDWKLADRNESPKPAGATGVIEFASGHANGSSSGSFTITGASGGSIPSDIIAIMVSLKTSTVSGLFQMNLADLASNWSIFSKDKDLSHSTLFYRTGSTTSVVPLPATGLMLLSALGLGGLAMRRKRR